MSATFVHLRLHSEYSLVDSLVRLKKLYPKVADAGMPAVALTDQCNFFGLVKFYNGCQGAGLKPICGADLWVEPREAGGEPSRITLLAMSEQGYRNLTEIISLGWRTGQHLGRAITQREWIKQYSGDLIALSGAREGEVGQALLAGQTDRARTWLGEWQAAFGDRYYLELIRTLRPQEEDYLHKAVALAGEMNCPVVATNDVRFLSREDYDAHETRVCIGDGRALDDPRRPHLYSEEQYLKTPAEMSELFSDIPEALANTVEIAKRCNIHVGLGKYFLPEFPVPEGMTMDQFFREVSRKGLEERLDKIFDRNDPAYLEKRQPYDERIEIELDTILQMGFPGYFLIVMDFIQWSKNNDVPVGPGRGSGAGSIVAWALKITDLDPIPYDLLFERFLNPERVSMPDFDVDFCMEGRDRVIDYVARTYGRDAVSQIVTFGTMAAKAVVRDVARAQGKSYGLADKLSKMIPFEVGMTLAKAYEQEEALREFLEGDEAAHEIWEMALKLEGITRNTGKHAGGVVIAPTKLTDFSPLYCDEEGNGLVTQYDKNDVESAGLVKFDFLGLRTLTIIDWALKMVNAKRAKVGDGPLDIMEIDLEDPTCYKMLQKAETTAVFQLESRGMKELIKRLLPSSFEDIIALVALFRPGPLQSGMVDDFIARKHGKAEVSYPHPDFQHESLKPILGPTYGVIVYQEQVMQIAQVLAGYTLGGADMLRRAMGKKKPEEMAKQRGTFEAGAIAQGVSGDLAMKIFDLVEMFAGYGFNKSHSAAYALVSYQTLWLKRHYPAPFMAAVMSSEMANTDKVVIFIEECRQMKLDIIPPDVSVSEYKFTVNDDDQIVYGLGAIKGVGEGPIEAICEARAHGGPFKDLFDFCARVDSKRINKRVLEALVRAGALDRLGPFPVEKSQLNRNRAVLAASMLDAVKAAEQTARSMDSGLGDLFGELVPSGADRCYEQFLQVPEWGDKQRLTGEKETLGVYLTGHPIDEYLPELKHFIRNRIKDLQPKRETQYLCGLIVDMRVMKTKRGDKMGFVTLDDRSGRVEASLFSEPLAQYQHLMEKDTLVIVEGEVSHDDFSGGLRVRASKLLSMADARSNYLRHLCVSLPSPETGDAKVKQLRQLLETSKGSTPMVVEVVRQDARAQLRLGSDWQVSASDDLVQELRQLFGKGAVQLVYPDPH